MNEKQSVNIYELAKATGYSISTVSKAINNTGRIGASTREKILEKAKELNYVASYHAKALSQKKSWIIGIIFADDLWTGFSHPYFSVILEHFKRRIEDNGYEATFINRNMMNENMTYLEFCKYRKVEGVFVVNSYDQSVQIPELVEAGIPLVTADPREYDIPAVSSNDVQGGEKATRYLASLNHKKIYHLAAPLYTQAGSDRHQGYINVCKELSIEPKVIEVYNFGFKDGYEMTKQLIDNNDVPTALFAGSDLLALGAISALEEHGYRVPEDVSVMGYDDLDLVKYMTPALTTKRQHKDKIGGICADLLINRINGQNIVSEVLDVELMERNTCIPLKDE